MRRAVVAVGATLLVLAARASASAKATYCGKGHLGLCRSEVWNAIQAAGNELTAQQGTPDPAAWRASAIDDQFSYTPLPLVTSPCSNRPTGIQQVISFK